MSWFFLTLVASAPLAQPTGEELLSKVIAYHDPTGLFSSGRYRFEIRGEYASGEVVHRVAEIDYRNGTLLDRYQRGGHSVVAEVPSTSSGEPTRDRCTLSVDGSATIEREVAEKLRLTCERARMYRDYLSYLWGLPMKLRDPGTRIDPAVHSGELNGKPVLELTARYEPDVGSDVWTFYIDPKSSRLLAYAFVKPDGDGETILLEGEVVLDDGTRLPKRRTWLVTKDRRHLGTDILLSATRL
ncbi:MAG: DUF6503 family protein [Myxococcota bacterium]